MSCACSGNRCQNRSFRFSFQFRFIEKGPLFGNTRLILPAKMLLVPVSVLSLAGRLCSGEF